MISLVHRFRLRQVARAITVRSDERLAERTRVAGELHDTLLQTIQGGKMVVDDALEKPSDAKTMHLALGRLSMWLNRAIGEGRAALNSLRDSTGERNDLQDLLAFDGIRNGFASMSVSLTVTRRSAGDASDYSR